MKVNAPTAPQPSAQPKIALAVAGGGPLGAIYEIGAMCALQESLDGLDFTALHHYVGVSAGGFIVAALANGMAPRELCALFIENTATSEDVFDPAWLMQPAYAEYVKRSAMVPRLLVSAVWQFAWKHRSWVRALEGLAPSMPTGLFSNANIDIALARLFSRKGRTNDFRQLKSRLTLVATHLDSAEAAPFGNPGWDHVPISKAVQASAALPGLFPPVEIDGEHYVDGALKKTMHASVALDGGVNLLICLNPLVPFNATAALEKDARIASGGLPAVLGQSLRAMIHSRMELGMKHYAQAYPDTDIILIEPDHRDLDLHQANTFSYTHRRRLAEHAYQQTRKLLRCDNGAIAAKLAKSGVYLNQLALNDSAKRLVQDAPRSAAEITGQALGKLSGTLDQLDHLLGARPSKSHG